MDENKGAAQSAAQGAESMQGAQGAESTPAVSPAAQGESTGTAKENGGIMQKFMDFLSQGEKKTAETKAAGKTAGAEKTYTQADLDAAVADAVAKAAVGGQKQPEKSGEGDMQKELAELKAQLLSRELHELAAVRLKESNLPADLAALLDYSSREKMQASLKTVADSFNSSIEAAVKDRLKGKTPLGLGMGNSKETIEEQIARAMKEGVR